MYDQLAQSQQPSLLERFVFTTLLPSLLVTSLLHVEAFWGYARPRPRLPAGDRCIAPRPELLSVSEFKPVDYHPPTILVNAVVPYPARLQRSGVAGTVVMQATVDEWGDIVLRSIRVVSKVSPRLSLIARETIQRMSFVPARLGGRVTSAPVTVAIAFQPCPGTTRARRL